MKSHATITGALLAALVAVGAAQQSGGSPPQGQGGGKAPTGIVPIPLPGALSPRRPSGGTRVQQKAPEMLPVDVEIALEQLNVVRRDRVVYFQAGVTTGPAARAAGAPSVTSPGQDGQDPSVVFWLVAELDEAIARKTIVPEPFTVDAAIEDASGASLANATGVVSAVAPTCTIRFPAMPAGPGDYTVRLTVKWSKPPLTESLRVTVPPGEAWLGSPLVLRSGPFTGAAFQATADPRFRKPERLRAEFPLAIAPDAVCARLLDRRGRPLRVPVSPGNRAASGGRVATADVALAPLAPGDYLVEVTARIGAREERALAAFRIVP